MCGPTSELFFLIIYSKQLLSCHYIYHVFYRFYVDFNVRLPPLNTSLIPILEDVYLDVSAALWSSVKPELLSLAATGISMALGNTTEYVGR